ncbi:MAG: DNA repair protein RadC [Nitrospira sp.]|nr:DNA repair protein RadC [Nitrospira sp.]MBS0194362.1 DNA repair protein RadC [Pseudomonadota bacterium]
MQHDLFLRDASPRAYIANEDAILAQAEHILRRRLERQGSLQSPTDSANFFIAKLAGLDHEEFHVLFLDNRHRILAVEMLSRGTIDGAEVYPREVAKMALRFNSAAVVLSHNHPSGSTEPSAADRAVTLRIKDALALLEIRVLDHIVVGGTGYCSLAARGWI